MPRNLHARNSEKKGGGMKTISEKIARAVVDEIILGRLVTCRCKDDRGSVMVWSSGTEEQLEATIEGLLEGMYKHKEGIK